MKATTNQPGAPSPGEMTSEKLLDYIPTASRLQRRIEDLVASVQALHNAPRSGVFMLDEMCRELNTLSDPLKSLMKVYVADIIELGNFCTAGGQVIFVDPPDSKDRSTATSTVSKE